MFRQKSQSQQRNALPQKSVQNHDNVFGSFDGNEVNQAAIYINNLDNSADQDQLFPPNQMAYTGGNSRQNKKFYGRQQGAGNMNKRYSQAPYKSQPRSGAARDLNSSSSITNVKLPSQASNSTVS